jgi:hypothetical protein
VWCLLLDDSLAIGTFSCILLGVNVVCRAGHEVSTGSTTTTHEDTVVLGSKWLKLAGVAALSIPDMRCLTAPLLLALVHILDVDPGTLANVT